MARRSVTVSSAIVIISTAFLFFTAGFWTKNILRSATMDVKAQQEAKPPPAQDSSWLKGSIDEKFTQIEKHFRGLDVAMAEIGYRYGELHFAAREQNWDYAGYQTEKIDLALRLALERRPKRAASSQAFLANDLPAVVEAIKSRDRAQMNRALDQLHNSCIACHRSENVLHFRSSVDRIRKNAQR